jgi:hypothetical protein
MHANLPKSGSDRADKRRIGLHRPWNNFKLETIGPQWFSSLVPHDGGTEMPLWFRPFRTTERTLIAFGNHCGGAGTPSAA